jgi:type IV pilus assembly protein PilM
MLSSKSFLAVDFGAANLKLAEFELTDEGGLLLKQYGIKSLGQEGTQDGAREAVTQKTLQEMLAEKGYGSKSLNICAPGFHTFSKFVKLPPVDTSKVTQIIQYEAQQNVPFPLEEVVWDYQILGAAASGELEVFLVAIKSDIVESLFRAAAAAGLRLQLVDVSPAALCNAFRYNYNDLDGCTMLLDIGAKTSNLLFFDKGTVYSRGINIGANAITLDFAKEARLALGDAERIKIDEGFVSLGGAYEEPENANQAAISKIARQVMTRLHIQVNQTIQFYRGQQGGAAPRRLFLSGGAAIMPYTAQFFSEKLSLPVDYFNPLRNVQFDSNVDLEELAKVAHCFGEVVGLGLRNLAHCPIELNLMPKSSVKEQTWRQKQPYVIASVFCLILILFAFGWFYNKVASAKDKSLQDLDRLVTPLRTTEQAMRNEMDQLRLAERELEQYTGWVEDRFYWQNVLATLRTAMQAVEASQEKELKTKMGIWIEKLTPMAPCPILTGVTTTTPAATGTSPQSFVTPGGGANPPANAAAAPPPSGRRKRGAASASTGGCEIGTLELICRGVDLTSADPAANTKIAYALQQELKKHGEVFDADGTVLSGTMATEPPATFTFGMTVKLKRPLKMKD